MQTSAEILFNKFEIYYENIFNLLDGFSKATNTNLSEIKIPLKKLDGTTEIININSFSKILNELSRIDNNFKSLLNEQNISHIVNADGSLSQYIQTNFINSEYLSNFKFGTQDNQQDTDVNINCLVDKTSMIKNMVFPNVKVPILLDNKINTDIHCKMFKVYDGYETIGDNPSLIDIQYKITNGIIIADEEELTLVSQKEQVKYFGKFNVIEVASNNNNESTIKLDKIEYGGLNTIGNSINLKIDDELVTNNGMSKYIITDIDTISKTLKVLRVAGTETIQVGIDKLFFNQTLENNNSKIVGVPVKPQEKLVIFLSTENLKSIGFPSSGIKLDTSTYTVTYDDKTYTLDEYFSKYVTNFYEYLYSIIKESTIPYSLGLEPSKPVLVSSNFSVVQINKHLTNSKSAQEIESLNTDKEKIKNKIDYNKTIIDKIQNEVDTIKYKSSEEKEYRLNELQKLKIDQNTLQSNLLTVSRNLNNNAIESGLKNIKAKYRIIGSWGIQNPIFSPNTKAQHIIKYDVQYRYLSKNIDTVENTSMKMVDESGKEISITYSAWNTLETRCLKKVINQDGTLTWEIPKLDSTEDININQVNIPIQEGESVELKVRAISEAGYPLSPKMSNWSEILRIDFPQNLTESNLNAIVNKNDGDLKVSEFNEILNKSGILKHIDNQIQEAEKLYYHKSDDIASGFFTPEQKNISLFSFLKDIKNDINLLKNFNEVNNLTIQVVDFNDETYTVTNNTTIDLFAGNYSDTLNLLDSSKWGSIIRKQAFIKIKNNNQVPLELKSLVPGTIFDETKAPKYFNVGVKAQDSLTQYSKQIFYFRNTDLTNQNEPDFKLVKPRLNPTSTKVPDLYIDNTAILDDKNIVYLDTATNTVKICKLLDNAGTDFIAFTKEHPEYNSNNPGLMIDNFNRLKLFTKNIKANQYQDEFNSYMFKGLGFADEDLFAIGENSTGAFLYPIINNLNSVSVVGDTTVSTLIIQANSEILIPIVYEYRMTDRLGKVNGINGTTINDILKYSKKIGIDLLINNELFRFDINVSSNLKSTVSPISSKNISSVVGRFNNEKPEILS